MYTFFAAKKWTSYENQKEMDKGLVSQFVGIS